MSRTLIPLSLISALLAGNAFADVPKVAVDIAPVHSLVARVMEGVGAPDLIIKPGASPHEYSLRPSEAKALQDAELVFWIGPDLTPWLSNTLKALASDATTTELLEAQGTIEFEFREGALFEAHDDHDEHDEHDEHGDGDHDEHDEHGDDHKDHDADAHEEDAHDDHKEEAGHEGHDHGSHDPHAWLAPQNAMTWMNVIAGQLSAADPVNAGAYFANAAAGRAEIEALIDEVNAILEPARGGKFIVFHDAYQYFENDFDFPATGAISISDASDPSPARIAEIRARIKENGIDCVLSEPQFNAGLVKTVLGDVPAKTGIIDPLGSELEPGSSFYPNLIRNMSSALADCM